jgi:hypothetical protein
MRHHTSTTPNRPRPVRSIRTGQTHHRQPVKDVPVKVPSYLHSTRHLAGLDPRRAEARDKYGADVAPSDNQEVHS